MQRRARAERGDEATHDAAQADMLRRTKKSVAESFRRMGGATRGSTRAPAPQPQPHSPAPAPAAGRAPQARRRGVPLGFIGSACIMIGFFMTFAAMAEGRENLAGPFIFLMIVGGLIGRIAKSRR